MFASEDRRRIHKSLIDRASADPRIVSAAAVGSSAAGGDRWSDIDLSFGIAGDVPVQQVLEDWTRAVVADYGAVVLFDLPFRTVIYRVFLLPGALQVDLSFAPAADFGAFGPHFRLLFGEAQQHPAAPAPSPRSVFGSAVHHAVRARICIERGLLWQAEYWLHEARDEALALACLRHGLPASYGRGFDDLPSDERARWAGALVASVASADLERSLAIVVAGLLREADDLPDPEERVRAMLEALIESA